VNFGQETLPWQPILWRETATSRHKTPYFVLAFYNGWKDCKTYTRTETLDVHATSVHSSCNGSSSDVAMVTDWRCMLAKFDTPILVLSAVIEELFRDIKTWIIALTFS